MKRRTRALAAAVLSLTALAGCGELRPGVAAEVGGETISMGTLDEFAAGICAYTSGSGQASGTSETRNSALNTLVYSRLAAVYAERLDITPDQTYIDQTTRQIDDALVGLDGEEREAFLDEVRVVLAGDTIIQQAVVERATAAGLELTAETGPAEQAAMLEEWSDDLGVDVDPRFGSWEGDRVVPASGSLSVDTAAPETVDPVDPTAGLPAYLTCR